MDETQTQTNPVDSHVQVVLYNAQTNTWIIDSGAFRHMTGNLALLSCVRNIEGGFISFADDKGGYITS